MVTRVDFSKLVGEIAVVNTYKNREVHRVTSMCKKMHTGGLYPVQDGYWKLQSSARGECS